MTAVKATNTSETEVEPTDDGAAPAHIAEQTPTPAKQDAVSPLDIAQDKGRYVFVDLARAITVLMMLQGHSLHVLLADEWKHNVLFKAWRFVRGLTAPMFLLLSGFSFSIATIKYWDKHLQSAETNRRRIQRFSFFLMLGYVIHVPAGIVTTMFASDQSATAHFLNVDVLQLIASSLILLQILVLLARTPQRFAVVCAAVALTIIFTSPFVRPVEWKNLLWSPLAAYLYSGTGSIFPLFGWSSFILLGASLGAWFMLRRPKDTNRLSLRFLLVGGVSLLIGRILRSFKDHPYYRPPVIPEGKPRFMFNRFGGAMFLLAGFVQLTRRFRRLGPAQALAEESLTVYVVHLCLLYGSVWSPGLKGLLGQSLGLGTTLTVIVLLVGSMGVIAYYWNRFKKTFPKGKHWARLGLAVVLAIPLI